MRLGLLARLTLTVFGGFLVMVLTLLGVALATWPASNMAYGMTLGAVQLAHVRAGLMVASGGAVPPPEVVAAVRRHLERDQPQLGLRLFDHGRPVGDDQPLDDLDGAGLAAVRADGSRGHGMSDPAYPGLGGLRYYALLGPDPEVVLGLRFPITLDQGALIRTRAVTVATAFGLVFVICAAQYLALRRTTRRITLLSSAVTGMADTGDFTRTVPVDIGSDEIGQLGAGVHALTTLLSTMASALQGASSQMAEAGQALTRTVGEQTQLLRQHTLAIEEAAASAEELRQTSETASQRAEAVLEAAMLAGELGDSGERAVQQTLEALGEIRSQVMDMGEQMAVVSERAHQISGITQSVKDIADSSNMLALNAAIEAVRSGEQGKGFALVAREMRRLADQSIKATERVREILEDVGVAIDQATAISSRGTQKIETGLGQLTRSGESVRALARVVSESSQSARVIAAAVRQQNVGIVQIARSIADQRTLAERTTEGLALTQTHADDLQALTREVSELLKAYRT